MRFSRTGNIFIVLIMSAVFTSGLLVVMKDNKITFVGQPAAVSDNILSSSPLGAPVEAPNIPQKLSNPPEIVKAVYVTGYSAGSKSYLNYLSNLFETTEINAVVVDIKGSDGYVSYASHAEEVKKYDLDYDVIKDINELVEFFHKQNVYVIGRMAVFEDPKYSKARPELAIYNKEKTTDVADPVLWKDNNGLSWLDPASKDVWDYNVSLAKDALLNHGFDEINFDYIRFPSDGKVKNMGFPVWDEKKPMAEVIKEFYQYLRTQLSGEKISADLFGQTTINKDDMGIGQLIENAFENFDYISPMVYPSHYADGFISFDNPAEHPYEVVKYSMDSARNRKNIFYIKNTETTGSPADLSKSLDPVVNLAKFRPWLQDFDMGADYSAEMVELEIKATQDSLGEDYNGFMLWNPSNIYTKGAVLNSN